MAQPFCDPFTACDGLDGRLLISAAIQGPPLAWDLGEVSFGAFTSTGVAARPYVDIHLHQNWTPKEACYGPIRSIFSLAPTETVQIAVSVRHQFSFAHAVSSASSDSRSTEGPVRSGSADDIASKKMKEQALVEQKMRYAGGYGSFWEVVANIIAPGVGGAIVNAAESVAKHAEETKDAVKDAMANAHQAVETIARSESQHSSTGSTTTSETTETVQSVTRMFSNPYRDRSLQLRFIPVFRHFEVRTWPSSVTPGIALHVGAARAVNQATLRVRDVLAQAPTQVDAAVLQQPLARLLSSSQEGRAQTKTSASGAAAAPSPGAAGALLWSQSVVREDSVLVPLAEPDTAASAFGLKGQSRAGFLKTLDQLRPEVVGKLFPVNVQHVHLFMGTHIEAVAGECILQDLPPLPAPE